MHWGSLSYVALAINPLGGLPIAIPFAMFALHYPGWLVFVIGVPCNYVQVYAVDAGWNRLNQWARFRRMFEGARSPRIERLVASRGAFWPTAALAPLVGPWVVMAFMRYANVPQRKVAAPILLGIVVQAIVLAAICTYAPALLKK